MSTEKELAPQTGLLQQSRRFLDEHSELKWIEGFVFDINGVPRGKWLPAASAEKLLKGGLQMPRSAVSLDIWGRDIENSPLVFASGDSDGVCIPVSPICLAPWHREATAQLHMQLHEADGSPLYADPRTQLQRVVEKLKALGYTAVCATELEFYLLREEVDHLERPRPVSDNDADLVPSTDVYDLSELDAQRHFFADVRAACVEQGIPADSILSECAPGQFEINLLHSADAVQVADQTLLFKRLLKGVARSHGLRVSTMAKPFGGQAGNGMHVHLSLVDSRGKNVFDDGSERGSDLLRHAVAGMLASANDAMAFFAPHSNSYRRFQESSHAPLNLCWGYDNRTTTLRVPASQPEARRIEHRIAGADTNPYLVLAAILAAVCHGLEHKLEPPEAVEGDAYQVESEQLINTWSGALDRFARSALWKEYLDPRFVELFLLLKHQELAEIGARVTDVEYQSYLHRV
ncbi:glutamine synthetase family protein [Microbulbifer thermotolerans]|uniref:Glutamine synthetase n=1 Tax=Microbulbifer thermotolerans TaxID=252514 RepID=A0A143HKW1_MICTH|nr:glutamine synthetase family protein [Microbulbifer thermotolerans]AMX02328.1 glutamine synthetase [Microbulbifer thermotolerans]MCX2780033.1 glutamine synthetase family protein [Microbulbifer thermotolerans]MCX2795111.1 glutamine synthetase family protein [Microbulbifer thermotolerans]MCX2801860.1 glutamine synthetase family protein [Microbulbifer thermotolerans]MCX2805456.1 glutamine synthetase family protein [Microbulbifer thermotolerans]